MPRPLPVQDIEGRTITCGIVSVPEDRANPEARKVELEFAVLKAGTKFLEPDPLVYLEGDPGGSAVTMLPTLYAAFNKFLSSWTVAAWRAITQRRER